MAEPLKATFFAFHKRERRGVLWRATLTHAALLLAAAIIAVVLNAGLLGAMAQNQTNAQPPGPIALMMWFFTVLVAVFVYFIVMASYEAACLRWLIRGETKGFGGFSLAGDTWRVWLGQWLWFVISLPMLLIASLLVSVGVAYFRAIVLYESLIPLAAFGLWALLTSPLALRLAPGNAASVGRRKFAYFDAWTVTTDRFRALAGSYLIVWTIWAVALVVVFLGLGMPVFAVLGDDGDRAPLINELMFSVLAITIVSGNMLAAFLLAGVNARAVLAAAREGKIDGVDTPDDVARVFE